MSDDTLTIRAFTKTLRCPIAMTYDEPMWEATKEDLIKTLLEEAAEQGHIPVPGAAVDLHMVTEQFEMTRDIELPNSNVILINQPVQRSVLLTAETKVYVKEGSDA